MSSLKHGLVVLIICACLFCPPQAQAASLCGLLCSCTVSTTSIPFGNYNPINDTGLTATGTVTVNCQLLSGVVSLLAPFTIALSKGQSGNYTTRQMLGPSSNLLNYNLYSNAAMTTVWGDGSGSSQTVSGSVAVSVIGVNVAQPETVYAQVPASQNAALGMYSDTITATVTY